MNSFDDQELVYLYMDGELSDAEYEAFEARLRQETKLKVCWRKRAIQAELEVFSTHRSLGAEDSGDG